MPRAPRSSSSSSSESQACGERPRPVAIAAPSIEQLEQRFAQFRREHRAHTRIPDALREAVLASMGQGVTPAQLRHCFGLSSKQLKQWQTGHGAAPAHSDLAAQETQDARVFSVVDDVPVRHGEPAGGDGARPLELRLDGWSICIRRVDL